MKDEEILTFRDTHIPRVCERCGKRDPEYKGVGEYRCAECGYIMYDDFGIVRNYLEAHRGATQSQVSQATGVSMETIRQFLREDRLEIAANSGVYMACEICRAPIRSGKYCESCAKKVALMKEESKPSALKNQMKGFGSTHRGDSGSMRFKR